jgi:hypothetical protein
MRMLQGYYNTQSVSHVKHEDKPLPLACLVDVARGSTRGEGHDQQELHHPDIPADVRPEMSDKQCGISQSLQYNYRLYYDGMKGMKGVRGCGKCSEMPGLDKRWPLIGSRQIAV